MRSVYKCLPEGPLLHVVIACEMHPLSGHACMTLPTRYGMGQHSGNSSVSRLFDVTYNTCTLICT